MSWNKNGGKGHCVQNDVIRITRRYLLVVNATEISYRRILSLPKDLNRILIMYLSTVDKLIV